MAYQVSGFTVNSGKRDINFEERSLDQGNNTKEEEMTKSKKLKIEGNS